MAQALLPVGALIDAVLVPPLVELGALRAQVGDERGRGSVGGIGAQVEAETLDGGSRLLLPVHEQSPRVGVQEHPTCVVALRRPHAFEVGEQGAGQSVRGQDVAAATQDEGRDTVEAVEELAESGAHSLSTVALAARRCRCADADEVIEVGPAGGAEIERVHERVDDGR